MKEILKKIIVDGQDLEVNLIERNIVIPNTEKIISLIGLRRVGKSYILFEIIQKLRKKISKDKILYINFDDERLYVEGKNLLDNLIEAYYELYPDNKDKKVYLFF